MAFDLRINRRNFLVNCGRLASASLFCSVAPTSVISAASGKNPEHQHEARWYEKIPHKKVKCTLCPRECVVDDRERGYCGVRENWDGIYYTLVHSNPCTYHNDPIEKKPLFHFLPVTNAFSIASFFFIAGTSAVLLSQKHKTYQCKNVCKGYTKSSY